MSDHIGDVNEMVCAHGSLKRQCYACELEAERDTLKAEIEGKIIPHEARCLEMEKALVAEAEVRRLKAELENKCDCKCSSCHCGERTINIWKAKAEKLAEALKEIRDIDYRGNHSQESYIAKAALADYEKWAEG